VRSDKIRPVNSDRYVVGVRFGKTIRKLFLIIPGNDGSLYVSFPYSPFDCGRVGILTARPNADSWIIGDEFPVTTQHVKYSHHPNGTVALSQKGRVRTIQKRGVPFQDVSGHIFSVTFQGIERYETISTVDAAQKRGRVYAAFGALGAAPAAYKFIAHIHSERELRERAANGGKGPWLKCVTPSGKVLCGVIFATTFQSQGASRFLLVSGEPVDKVCATTDEFLVFIGGFDPPQIALNPAVDTSALMFLYPENDYNDELLRRVGTIDLTRPTSR
jgi:hypothetical protein